MAGNGKKQEGQNVAVGAGVGAGAGVFLANLLAGKPVSAAPDTAKLDYIASLLEQILVAVKNPSGAFPGSLLTPWIADKDPLQIYQQAIRSVGVFQSDIMIDMRNIKRLAIRAESSLDQAVALQLVGNFADSFALPVNVGPPAVCPINGQAGFGLAWGDWQPYIGVIITAAIAPTIGLLTIWAVAQE